jgi:hypothetical protein
MENLKEKIKVLADQQVMLRNQKRTVRLKGERTMEPWKAYLTHQNNRAELRKLYMEYGILKGKKPEQIDINYKEVFSNEFINQLTNQYEARLEVIRSSAK